MLLTDIIIQKIKSTGPISFREFMDMALYYPGAGYYTSDGDKIGKSGDFFTTPWFSSLFGKMVAKQLEEMWMLLGKKPFTVVEYGAGTGVLCRDILNHLKSNGQLYDQLSYRIIEKSAAMREKEKSILDEKVSWHDSILEIPAINGCVISNEVVDNFPVHLVYMDDELMEIFVDHKNEFIEVMAPASPELKYYFEELNVTLPKEFRAEINLQAKDWIKDIANNIEKGFLITIDYGFPSSALYDRSRSRGTLACYHNHKINRSPYINIGGQDITAHVNFSALNTWGSANGLEYTGYTNQAYFLQGLGLADHLKKMEQNDSHDINDIVSKARLIHTFLVDMGSKFKVMIQQKGLPRANLSGMQFDVGL